MCGEVQVPVTLSTWNSFLPSPTVSWFFSFQGRCFRSSFPYDKKEAVKRKLGGKKNKKEEKKRKKEHISFYRIYRSQYFSTYSGYTRWQSISENGVTYRRHFLKNLWTRSEMAVQLQESTISKKQYWQTPRNMSSAINKVKNSESTNKWQMFSGILFNILMETGKLKTILDMPEGTESKHPVLILWRMILTTLSPRNLTG